MKEEAGEGQGGQAATSPADIRHQLQNLPKDQRPEVWSCDPASIQPWTDESKQRLTAALAVVFGWATEASCAVKH